MSDLAAAVRAATARMSQAGIDSARRDAVLLAAHVLGVSPGEVERRALVGSPEPEAFDALVDERCRRVPLQHLTGKAPFRRLELFVGPGVFVPRPETEILVDVVLAEVGAGPARVLDLCTGSGALAFAVAQECPGAHVVAVELGAEALAWARRNRDDLGLAVDLRAGDATSVRLDDVGGEPFDVVVSNPPYIPDGAVPIDPEVRDHDPEMALYGRSADGLAVPRAVASRAADLLLDGGLFVMEHADVQGEALVAHLSAGPWRDVHDLPDLTGRPRAVVARRAARDAAGDAAVAPA